MKEIQLSIPGFTVAAKTWGAPKNPPILALHGWLDNANSFDLLAPYLEPNFYLIAVDLPGHGHSSHLPEGCYYHFFDAIFTVIEILDALKCKKVHLLGHSMGACLASMVAGVLPTRFDSLLLIEGLGPFSAPAQDACAQLSAYAEIILDKKPKQIKGYDKFRGAALARSLKGYLSLALAKILCERSLVKQDERFYWRHDKRLLARSPLRMTEEQVLSCLQAIVAPSLLITATQGFLFNKDLMQKRQEAVAELTVQMLEGGHHVHMEKPQEVATIVLNFLKQ